MIALKVPADAARHPYQLVAILAATGTEVTKGDPVFKLSRAGSQRNTTFRAPVSGTIGRYLITAGADLLSEPGQHIVTLDRAEIAKTPNPEPNTAAGSQEVRADRVEMLLPNNAELLPARINAWLVSVGDPVALGQTIAQITLADGRKWDLTSKATGLLGSVAAQEGEYITQMQRLCCTIIQHPPQEAQINTPVDPPKTASPASASKPQQTTAPHIAMGPDAPENYPMQLIEWHVEEGDFVGKGQVLMTLRRASGETSILRSIETGRLLSKHVAAGTSFGISDVLYAISTTQEPPLGWQMPPDPVTSKASPKPVSQSNTSPMPSVSAKPSAREGQKTTAPEPHTASSKPLKNAENGKVLNIWLFGFLIAVGLAVSTTYLFTGSRIIATATMAVFLFVLLLLARNPLGFVIGIVPVVMLGIFMIAPQDVILPPVVTPWEPFISSGSSPDGEWHGDIWENITRPRPTKRQQAQFDAWLEE